MPPIVPMFSCAGMFHDGTCRASRWGVLILAADQVSPILQLMSAAS